MRVYSRNLLARRRPKWMEEWGMTTHLEPPAHLPR